MEEFPIKQLQPDLPTVAVEVLCQNDLRSDLAALIQKLYDQSPDDDVTDADIMAEVKAVRQQAR
jgi:hypothetical protein